MCYVHMCHVVLMNNLDLESFVRCMCCCVVQCLAVNAGNSDVAHQRMEDMILLGITSLAGLTYLPLAASEPKHNIKAKVSESFGKVLCEPSLANVTADYLLLLSHPGTCATVLKVI